MIGKCLSADQGENNLLRKKGAASRMGTVHLVGRGSIESAIDRGINQLSSVSSAESTADTL